MILRGSVIVLALAGLADALYFTLAYYGRVRQSRWVPQALCAREGSNCVSVVRTPYARVFGVPNSLLGILYYVLVAFWAATGVSARLTVRVNSTAYIITFTGLLIAASAVTVVLGFYLVFALRRILHTDCPLCYAAHFINMILLVLLVLSR